MTALDNMLAAYVECALWSESVGDDFAEQWTKDNPSEEVFPDVSLESFGFTCQDIAPEAIDAMRQDCAAFLSAAAELGHSEHLTIEQVGHDFWLTRNHHGAGFWDRGLGTLGDQLTELADPFGESNLYVGDDGKVYVS